MRPCSLPSTQHESTSVFIHLVNGDMKADRNGNQSDHHFPGLRTRWQTEVRHETDRQTDLNAGDSSLAFTFC